jgi:hypothetical protein
MRLIAITAALVVAGCAPGAVPNGAADGGTTLATPTTGIYRLSEHSTGDCMPALADDSAGAFVIQDPSGDLRILVPLPSFASPSGLGVTWRKEVLHDGTSTIVSDLCGAKLSGTFSTEQSTSDHLRVRRVDAFGDVAASTCSPAARPTNDCTLTTEIDYQLVQPCTSQCIQLGMLDSNGIPELSCSC